MNDDILLNLVNQQIILAEAIKAHDDALKAVSGWMIAISKRLDEFETRLLYLEKFVSDKEMGDNVFRQ